MEYGRLTTLGAAHLREQIRSGVTHFHVYGSTAEEVRDVVAQTRPHQATLRIWVSPHEGAPENAFREPDVVEPASA